MTASVLPQNTPRRLPVQGRSTETCRRIEDATERLLARGVPLAAMTTQQIAKEAGLSIGALYRFFPDKQTIVEAVAIRRLADFEESVAADVRNRPHFASPAALISHIIDFFVAYLEAHPDFRTILYEGDNLSTEIRTRHFGATAKSAIMARRYAVESFNIPDTAELTLRWRLVGEISGPLIGLAMNQPDAASRAQILRETKLLIGQYLFGGEG
jgi:AcrR family transcriptional regulator